jgi:hypothetical protein
MFHPVRSAYKIPPQVAFSVRPQVSIGLAVFIARAQKMHLAPFRLDKKETVNGEKTPGRAIVRRRKMRKSGKRCSIYGAPYQKSMMHSANRIHITESPFII